MTPRQVPTEIRVSAHGVTSALTLATTRNLPQPANKNPEETQPLRYSNRLGSNCGSTCTRRPDV